MLDSNVRQRIERTLVSLEGLSVGDAFGQLFFGRSEVVVPRVAARRIPSGPWTYTDDTEMALALTETLLELGCAEPGALARAFVRRYVVDPNRGYGAGAHEILQQIRRGASWEEAAGGAFEGKGSMGNGGAMRVAPLGAYYADDTEALVREALASAKVTHAHPEGQAGAVAVAAAAAFSWLSKHRPAQVGGSSLIEFAMDLCPGGETRDGLKRAKELPADASVETAVEELGNGSRVISSDTVPFALWCAQHHLDDFQEALWTTVAGLGDRDTTCAIVGGIVAVRSPPPVAWVEAREPLRFESSVAEPHKGMFPGAVDTLEAWVWRLREAPTRK